MRAHPTRWTHRLESGRSGNAELGARARGVLAHPCPPGLILTCEHGSDPNARSRTPLDTRSANCISVGNRLTYAQFVNRSKGILLLGVWIILSNLVPLLSIRIPNSNLLLAVLGIVAGVLVLVDK